MPKKKHVPPAKIKYDKTHPIVSVRVDLELKKKLGEITKLSGKSVGDILREAVKVQAPSVKNAYDMGYETAKFSYRVLYKCSICGEVLEVNTPDTRKAAAKYMEENGWAHTSCLEKSNQQAL